MSSATKQTSDDLVEQSCALIQKVLTKQMRALLEEMEVQWRKEFERANGLQHRLEATILRLPKPLPKEALQAGAARLDLDGLHSFAAALRELAEIEP